MVERRRARNIYKARGKGAKEVCGGEEGGLLSPENLRQPHSASQPPATDRATHSNNHSESM